MIWIHVVAGLTSLAAGAVALYAAKGSALHRKSGLVFVVAMATMTSSAFLIAAFFRPNPVNVIAATITFYLVATSLLTVRRTVAEARQTLTVLMAVAFAVGAFAFTVGFEALASPTGTVGKVPAPPIFMFGVVGIGAALLDARLLRAGSIHGPARLTRHLWRMSFAMWVATTSFFLGQAKVFPEPVRKIAFLAVPPLLVIVVTVYWLVRVRLGKGARLPAGHAA